tara:strand:+ start:97 stop:342 length:246 start_codon:yes stop_codon:yes gene_type:complete
MLPAKKKKLQRPEPEREIFDLDRSDRVVEAKPPKKLRVRIVDVILECFKGNTYVEMEAEEEEAFEDNERDFGTITVKEEDI